MDEQNVDGLGASAHLPQGPSTCAPAGSGEAVLLLPQGHAVVASPHADTIALIRALHRKDQFAIAEQVRAGNALGAFVRTWLGWSLALPAAEREAIRKQAAWLIEQVGDPSKVVDGPYAEAAETLTDVIRGSAATREPWDRIRASVEREMQRLATKLPAAELVAAAKGFGWLSYARIVGEAGDLAAYPKHGHLWKRMGLAVIDGVRQGGLRKGAGAEAWIAHGYKPQRRAGMFVIGESLIKADGPYRALYLRRLVVEHGKALDDMLLPVTTAKATVESWAARGLPPLTLVRKPELHEGHRTAGHMHARAKRWVEKRLLRDLWRAWRGEAKLAMPIPAGTRLPPLAAADEEPA